MKNFFRKLCASFVGRAGTLVAIRLVSALAILIVIGLSTSPLSQAQKADVPAKVSNVTSKTASNGTVVSIGADTSLGGAQTWHDSEGYHVVLPNAVSTDSVKTGGGIKVRQLGTSLEVVLQTKPGARISVQPANNQLNIGIDGELDAKDSKRTGPDSRDESATSEEQRLFEDTNQRRTQIAPFRLSSPLPDLSLSSRPAETSGPSISSSSSTVTSSAPPVISSNQIAQNNTTAVPETTPAEIAVQPEDDGFLASIFSGTSVFIVMALGLFGLLVSRKLRSRQELAAAAKGELSQEEEWVDDQIAAGTSLQQRNGPAQTSTSLVRFGGAPANASSRQSVARMPVAGPTSLYGAYRIDQEVSKLLLGQPHRIDVLASRAIDDRRAIETSLIKGVNSEELDDDGRRRAREALDEYGFVARQCASMLLAPEAYERTSAAQSLGDIKSPAALPFLLEALYDSEAIVRNQAVVSIGELKLPAAIGALLDIARKHPDVPSALLSRTLSACSVEGLDFFDTVLAEPSQLMGAGNIVDEITHLEPTSDVEDLPESSEDEGLARALASLNSEDVEERSEALKALGQFQVQSAVNALAKVAGCDVEPSARSLAISSLGSINHESVFPAVLIGMADETREVRAAAARSLNRLSFDRSDAYVRVIQSSDDETIRNVAKACIQAGIVSQNLDRLASSDHRQAYETFSLICLLAKAKMNEPVLDAIANHGSMDVRLKAVHLLACAGESETFEQLRQLAVRDGIGEEVKTALLEAMYKMDQARIKEEEMETVEAMAIVEESDLELPETGAEFQTFEIDSEPNYKVEVQQNLEEFEP